MRTVVSLLIAATFVVLSLTIFLSLTVVGYAKEREALVASARAADLHAASVAVLTEMILADDDEAPLPGTLDPDVVRLGVETVVTEAWVDETVREVHAALERVAAGTDKTAVVPLHLIKSAISERLLSLEEATEERCRSLFGKLVCRDPEAAAAAVEAYRLRVAHALGRLPDRYDLGPEIRFVSPDGGGVLQGGRNALLAALVICLVLLGWAHRRSTSDALGWIGGTLLAAALICLLVAGLARFAGETALGDRMVSTLERETLPGATEELAIRAARRFSAQIVADATHGDWQTLLPLASLGGALVLFGRIRRKRPAAVRDEAPSLGDEADEARHSEGQS